MTKGEQARLMAWRLRVLQQAADEQNVARVCRRFGMTRRRLYPFTAIDDCTRIRG
jgi:hypothetical protein